MTSSGRPDWGSPDSLRRHFKKHGRAVSAKDEREYLRSARDVIQVGVPFTFRWGRKRRVGYYHRGTRRLTVLTEDGDAIVTHYVESEKRVRAFPESTYPKR